ncbi:MAG: DUF4013 domain-containing protein [Litorilinea sp.]
MDIGKALSYITEDPRWKEKIAIGTGVVILSSILSIVFIGVVGFLLVAGYMVRLLQNVRDGHAHPMPEWDQWGEDLVRGLKLVVVVLVWSLPAILFSIPVSLGGVLVDGQGASAFIGSTILFGGMCLVVLYSLFIAVAQASFTIAFARDEKISSGLQVREIWDWTVANIGQLVIVALAYIVVSIGVSLVGSIVGVLLCIIGLVVTLPLAQLVIYLFQYHLYGQLAATYPFGSPVPRGDGDGGDGSGGDDSGLGGGPGASAGMGAGAAVAGGMGSDDPIVAATGVAETGAGDAPVASSAPSSVAPSGETVADGGSTFEDNPYAAFGPKSEVEDAALATPTEPAEAELTATGVSVEDEATLAATETPESETPATQATGDDAALESTAEDEETYPDSGIEDDKSKPAAS